MIALSSTDETRCWTSTSFSGPEATTLLDKHFFGNDDDTTANSNVRQYMSAKITIWGPTIIQDIIPAHGLCFNRNVHCLGGLHLSRRFPDATSTISSPYNLRPTLRGKSYFKALKHRGSITTGGGGGYNKARRPGAVPAPGAFPPCAGGGFLARVQANKKKEE